MCKGRKRKNSKKPHQNCKWLKMVSELPVASNMLSICIFWENNLCYHNLLDWELHCACARKWASTKNHTLLKRKASRSGQSKHSRNLVPPHFYSSNFFLSIQGTNSRFTLYKWQRIFYQLQSNFARFPKFFETFLIFELIYFTDRQN